MIDIMISVNNNSCCMLSYSIPTSITDSSLQKLYILCRCIYNQDERLHFNKHPPKTSKYLLATLILEILSMLSQHHMVHRWSLHNNIWLDQKSWAMEEIPHCHHRGAIDLVLFFVDSKLEFLQAFATFYEFPIKYYKCGILCISSILAGVFDMQRYFELCYLYSHAQDTELHIVHHAFHIMIHLVNLQDH